MIFGALLLLEVYCFHLGYAAIVHNPAIKHVKALYGEKHVGNTFHSDGTVFSPLINFDGFTDDYL